MPPSGASDCRWSSAPRPFAPNTRPPPTRWGFAATTATSSSIPITARLGELSLLCDALGVLGEASPRALDAVGALGERMSIHLLAAALRARGVTAQAVDAASVVRTDDTFQAAVPLMDETRRLAAVELLPLLAAHEVPVITGFIGATADGVVTTLGRGGSDYSGAIIGAAIDADEVWIYTDVDGVMTADPRVVQGVRTLESLSYLEMSELAYFGAKVLHPKTILPALERGIPIRIKNTFNPSHPGTLVVGRSDEGGGGLKGVTAIRAQSLVTIAGRGMLGVPGIAARAFGAVARTGTSVSMISQASSEQSICFLVAETIGGHGHRRAANGVPPRAGPARHRGHLEPRPGGHRHGRGRRHQADAGRGRPGLRRARAPTAST